MFKRGLSGAALTALAGAMLVPTSANAQSTASQIQEEEIVVTAQRRSMDGIISNEQASKARSTITQDYIEQQTAGQSILNSINLVPGVNFTNNDPYGSSGGNIRMRGFDGNRVSLTFDGIPLNDTGNYAIFSNQMLDPELITRANVSMGTTDFDSPTASATGGTVNYVTRMPSETAGLMVQPSVGTDNYYRLLTMVDTGAFGPWGTTAFGAVSYQSYDQFIGPGDLEKLQLNARFFQPLQGDDFISLAFHYNRNRNAFYRQGSLQEWEYYGDVTNTATCARDLPTNGVADLDGATPFGTAGGRYLVANDNPANPGACTNFYRLRTNPSNTANIRGQSRFSFGDNVTFTFDPMVQYVLANGGGTTVVSETDTRLAAGFVGSGIDLNADGDILDQVRLYSPSNTNTMRYGVLSSLIWDINDTNRLIVGYSWDQGRHRQTGEYGTLDNEGGPNSFFGGKEDEGDPILTRRGEVFQKRNRLSTASLSQWSVRYIGDFFDDALTVDLGIRAPVFDRELDQRCFAAAGSSSDPTCGTGATPPGGAVAPFKTSVQYDDILPNIGLTWRPSESQQVFVSYAEGLSAPRTDDLYNGLTPAQLREIQPETSQAYDVGYRYQSDRVTLSTTGWFNAFQNRIVRVFDQDQGINISRNVGNVSLWGAEFELGWRATEDFSTYFSLSRMYSEVQDNLRFSATTFAPTQGKSLVETPEWTAGTRFEYEAGPFTFGAQAKYVGERFATDVNDQIASSYTTLDLDVRWDLGETLRNENTYLQLNVINLFDERYYGSISTQVCTTGNNACPAASQGIVRYNLGAPQTFMLTLRAEF
jgi:iron complex outermembrane receptor protein